MSMQSLDEKCLCLKCPFRLRKDCSHYREVCLKFRSCSACLNNNGVVASFDVLGEVS
jgi:hypothetical protein